MNRLYQWLPASTADRRVRVISWALLLSQTVIVGTGGAVRLTGSGLGCPTWPRCTAESWVTTQEMGFHGVIEFGNRALGVLVALVAVLAFLAVWRSRKERPELLRLALAIGLGTLAQVVIGGVTVLTGLNPWIVGVHFVLSAALIALAVVYVHRVYRGRTTGKLLVPRSVRILAIATAVGVWSAVLIGVVLTGSGPHAGDEYTPRNGLDSEVLQHVHSWPAYITFGLSVLLLVVALRLGLAPLRRAVIALVAVEVVQIAVGLAQARLGLPELLVGIHMVLACVLIAVVTLVLLTMRRMQPAAAVESTADELLASAR